MEKGKIMDLPFYLVESTAMFSFVRLRFTLADDKDKIVSASILRKGKHSACAMKPVQNFSTDTANCGIIEVLLERKDFPDDYHIEVVSRASVFTASCRNLVEDERTRHSRSGLDHFLKAAAEWRLSHPGAMPKVLDIGGRARSGYLLAEHLPGCDVTVLDIHSDTGVDVVADIHEMSDILPTNHFDFIVCVSVFEHLVMPWKAAIEINKVLRQDGVIFIQTHQTVGLHDRPWDYFRFSDDSWKGIFNRATGFEILETFMSNFVRITPMRYYAIEPTSEQAGGFYESSVVAKKIAATKMIWPVALSSIVDTAYPA